LRNALAASWGNAALGGALGTGVAHRFEDVTDVCDGIIGWNPGRGIVPGGIERALAGVWIGAVLRPAVLFAFVDGAGLLQQVDSPAAQRPDVFALAGASEVAGGVHG
jgi:hypothetical protein